jgi:hypothetical protein
LIVILLYKYKSEKNKNVTFLEKLETKNFEKSQYFLK